MSISITDKRHCIECDAPLFPNHSYKRCNDCEPLHFEYLQIGDIVKVHNSGGWGNRNYIGEQIVQKITRKRIETNRGVYSRVNGVGVEALNKRDRMIHKDNEDQYTDQKVVPYRAPRATSPQQ